VGQPLVMLQLDCILRQGLQVLQVAVIHHQTVCTLRHEARALPVSQANLLLVVISHHGRALRLEVEAILLLVFIPHLEQQAHLALEVNRLQAYILHQEQRAHLGPAIAQQTSCIHIFVLQAPMVTVILRTQLCTTIFVALQEVVVQQLATLQLDCILRRDKLRQTVLVHNQHQNSEPHSKAVHQVELVPIPLLVCTLLREQQLHQRHLVHQFRNLEPLSADQVVQQTVRRQLTTCTQESGMQMVRLMEIHPQMV
jgi:hypothetical protein